MFSKIINAITSVEKKTEIHSRVHLIDAKNYEKQQKYPEAVKSAEAAYQGANFGSDIEVRALFVLGIYLFKLGRYDDVIYYYELIANENPAKKNRLKYFDDWQEGLAIVLWRLAAAYNRVSENKKHEVKKYNERYKEAAKWARYSLGFSKDKSDNEGYALAELGFSLEMQEDLNEAIERYSAAIERGLNYQYEPYKLTLFPLPALTKEEHEEFEKNRKRELDERKKEIKRALNNAKQRLEKASATKASATNDLTPQTATQTFDTIKTTSEEGIASSSTNQIDYQLQLNKQLIVACIEGNLYVTKKLIARRANVNFQFQITENNNPNGMSFYIPLGIALARFYNDIVCELLDNGADINARDEWNNPPLVVATQAGNMVGMKHLLNRGVNVNVTGNHHRTALQWAVEKNNQDIIKFTCTVKAHELNFRHRDDFNETAYQIAIRFGYTDTAQYLQYMGLDIDARREIDSNRIYAEASVYTSWFSAAIGGANQIAVKLVTPLITRATDTVANVLNLPMLKEITPGIVEGVSFAVNPVYWGVNKIVMLAAKPLAKKLEKILDLKDPHLKAWFRLLVDFTVIPYVSVKIAALIQESIALAEELSKLNEKLETNDQHYINENNNEEIAKQAAHAKQTLPQLKSELKNAQFAEQKINNNRTAIKNEFVALLNKKHPPIFKVDGNKIKGDDILNQLLHAFDAGKEIKWKYNKHHRCVQSKGINSKEATAKVEELTASVRNAEILIEKFSVDEMNLSITKNTSVPPIVQNMDSNISKTTSTLFFNNNVDNKYLPLADNLKEIATPLDCYWAAKASYRDHAENGKYIGPNGKHAPHLKVMPQSTRIKDVNIYLIQNTITNKYLVAFEGTKHVFSHGLNLINPDRVIKKINNLLDGWHKTTPISLLTGHSQGGYYATRCDLAKSIPQVTFNAHRPLNHDLTWNMATKDDKVKDFSHKRRYMIVCEGGHKLTEFKDFVKSNTDWAKIYKNLSLDLQSSRFTKK